MDSLKKLATAILTHALVDAQKGCQEAREWIIEDDFTFPIWCQIYGVDPTSARQRLCTAMMAQPARELLHERIIQVLTETPGTEQPRDRPSSGLQL